MGKAVIVPALPHAAGKQSLPAVPLTRRKYGSQGRRGIMKAIV